jgi:nucleoside-diphosphate-sugar epimerase
MLGLAKRLRCKILQASTSEVYGDPSIHPQTEEYWGNVNPIAPRSCYDEGKRRCYVDDLVDGLIRLMKTADDVTGPINLGNPAEFKILDLAAQIIDITGSHSKIVFRPLP